ncbi:MAG TPA: hypothetical protein PKH77_26200 [Anaerolineae bacterium]|nr:hypothetical protein [Anaerolineae bacterium]
MQHAIFAGLVVDETDQMVAVTYLGGNPHYVVDDAGFLRHIPASKVDRQVLGAMQGTVLQNKEAVVAGMLQYLGKDDLFTKAAIETAITQMDANLEQLVAVGMPDETRQWLGLMGFKVVINVHGEVVTLNMPGGMIEDM